MTPKEHETIAKVYAYLFDSPQNSTEIINIILQEPAVILLKSFKYDFCEGIGQGKVRELNA